MNTLPYLSPKDPLYNFFFFFFLILLFLFFIPLNPASRINSRSLECGRFHIQFPGVQNIEDRFPTTPSSKTSPPLYYFPLFTQGTHYSLNEVPTGILACCIYGGSLLVKVCWIGQTVPITLSLLCRKKRIFQALWLLYGIFCAEWKRQSLKNTNKKGVLAAKLLCLCWDRMKEITQTWWRIRKP